MKFKIAKKEFLDALNLSSKAISSTTPLPVLGGIKIVVTNESLILISSDSNISIKTAINNNDTSTLVIEESGEVVIDAKYLLEIVRKIDSNFINVEIIDGTLVKIFGGSSEFKINGMKAFEYPEISFDLSNENPFKLSTAVFSQLIDETSFACSDKETRPVLTGVNLKAEDNKLFVNATDSYRLASKTVNLDTNLNFNITVPAKYLNDITHSLTNIEEVTIVIDNQKISFVFGNTVISTRLLDDAFPDTNRLIPTNFTQTLLVNSREMINAVDRSSFIKSDGKSIVKLSIAADKIEINSSNQIGSSYEKVNVIKLEGEPLEISCSGKYLTDAIKAIGKENVLIKFSGELKPMIIVAEDDNELIQLISPVRTYH